MANLSLTRKWAENIYQLETSDPVMGGPDGIDNRQAKELGARTNWLKDQVDAINSERTGYAPKVSPAFSGVPTAPTAPQSTNNAQLATTAFVKTAIANLVGSAPETLDTLAEIATALSGDANLKETLLNEIGKKADATAFTALHDLFIGIPIPHPLTTVPEGCLAMNGQRFDKSRYPKLAQKYPSGQLPDLRGEFIRGWDNGRGVDAGRGVLSSQTDLVGSHKHRFGTYYSRSEGNKIKKQGKKFEYEIGTATGVVNVDRKFSGELYDNFENIGVALSWGDGGSMYSDRVISMIGDYKETRPRNIAFHYICLAA